MAVLVAHAEHMSNTLLALSLSRQAVASTRFARENNAFTNAARNLSDQSGRARVRALREEKTKYKTYPSRGSGGNGGGSDGGSGGGSGGGSDGGGVGGGGELEKDTGKI